VAGFGVFFRLVAATFPDFSSLRQAKVRPFMPPPTLAIPPPELAKILRGWLLVVFQCFEADSTTLYSAGCGPYVTVVGNSNHLVAGRLSALGRMALMGTAQRDLGRLFASLSETQRQRADINHPSAAWESPQEELRRENGVGLSEVDQAAVLGGAQHLVTHIRTLDAWRTETKTDGSSGNSPERADDDIPYCRARQIARPDGRATKTEVHSRSGQANYRPPASGFVTPETDTAARANRQRQWRLGKLASLPVFGGFLIN